MIIDTKTQKGTPLTIDLKENILTIPQGSFPFVGPIMISLDGKLTPVLEFTMSAKTMHAALSENDHTSIRREQIKIDDERLERLFPGITLLKEAHKNEIDYQKAFARMMDTESNDGVNPPRPPKLNAEELSAQYPLAALYLKAESYACSSNYKKSSAGAQAKEILENGSPAIDAEQLLNNWIHS